MFSYYGSKSKIVDLYPPPKYGKIIEPFAGSARYSLKYWDRDILLVDKYPVIIDVWTFLRNCSPKDILSLPKLQRGLDIRELNISDEERLFLGFLVNQGSSSPKNIVSEFAAHQTGVIKKISKQVNLIKHWKFNLLSYDEIENEDATWFVDPPYQFGGEHYKMSNKTIDFNALGVWCKSRLGQVIVCENTKADWMCFKPMKDLYGAYSLTTEAIWSNLPTNYDAQQQKLF
jgi:hypothetical protein